MVATAGWRARLPGYEKVKPKQAYQRLVGTETSWRSKVIGSWFGSTNARTTQSSEKPRTNRTTRRSHRGGIPYPPSKILDASEQKSHRHGVFRPRHRRSPVLAVRQELDDGAGARARRPPETGGRNGPGDRRRPGAKATGLQPGSGRPRRLLRRPSRRPRPRCHACPTRREGVRRDGRPSSSLQDGASRRDAPARPRRMRRLVGCVKSSTMHRFSSQTRPRGMIRNLGPALPRKGRCVIADSTHPTQATQTPRAAAGRAEGLRSSAHHGGHEDHGHAGQQHQRQADVQPARAPPRPALIMFQNLPVIS